MRWQRKRPAPPPPAPHRGRIFTEDGWWRYACTDCDYGAGGVSDGWVSRITHRWLIKTATEHTSPQHWSRNRRQ